MATLVRTVQVGLLQVNCHLVWEADTGTGVIIDPGADAERIAAQIAAAGFIPAAVLLTHAHVDHIGAVGDLSRRYGIGVFLAAEDLDIYRSRDNCFPPWLPAVEDLPAPAGRLPAMAGLSCRVLATPGHTPGSVCFLFPEAGLLCSGDTLFSGGVGRTDFPGGSQAALVQSIRDVLYRLPDTTRVLPGHNGPTSIGAEKGGNPFVRPENTARSSGR